MSLSVHRRRIVLFVAAIIVPCLVLVALSIRMISQERELAEKRLTEDRHRLVSQARQELLAKLERIKFQEISALAMQKDPIEIPNSANTPVALVCYAEPGRLMLPWEDSERAEEFQRVLAEAEYAKRIDMGEQQEFAGARLSKAVKLYQEAIIVAHHPAQIAYAQLLISRALAKSGRQSEARVNYQKLVMLPGRMTDENGVPLWLYAAERLFQMEGESKTVLDRIKLEMAAGYQFSPAGAYLLRELLKGFVTSISDTIVRENAEQLQQDLLKRIRHVEQALALKRDFPNLALGQVGVGQHPSPESPWTVYGEDQWLVTLAPSPVGGRSILLAVRAKEVFASFHGANFRLNDLPVEIEFVTGNQPGGELLGENFPGLKVAFRVSDESALRRPWTMQSSFYLIVLFLVLSVTLFGAYLLWRDVRRDLRLAEMRSQFVSSVSHELKTPLTSIRMFAETLRLGRTKDRPTQDEYLDTIVNESERLTRLLNNVLDFSKIEQGKKTYHLESTSLAEVARASVQALEYPLAQQGFDLQVEVESDLPAVAADRDALQQAILNLLTNAMKYSGANRQIGLRLGKQSGDAVIQVSDRGLGIPAEEQNRVFEKFYRGSTPEVGIIPGTGLGLTLVAHIAKAHGGRVEVQSEIGKGSIFSIHIPLESAK